MADNRPLWFASFVLVVFCLGGVAGFLIATHWGPPRPEGPGMFEGGGGPGRGGRGRGGPPPLFGGRGPGGPPPLPPELFNRLTSELDLDATQRDQLKKILDDRREGLEAVHREARERFEKAQRELHTAIRAILRAEQQTRFDNFLDRRR